MNSVKPAADMVPLRTRVTIRDLADKLGVTKSTVSRALNGYPDISERTRQRVQKMADVLGYSPLSHAQAIRTGRSRAIGFVLQSDLHDGYRPFLSEFLAGLTQAASAENWTLTVAQADSEADVLTVFRRLTDEHKVDGFVLPRTQTHDPRITMLRERQVPFVLFGRTGDDTGCAWYDILGEDAMREAVLRLVEQGHRRIAHIGGQAGYHYARLREEGYLAGLAAAGIAFDPVLLIRDGASHAKGLAAGRALLRLDAPPTAIVAAVDEGALGAYGAATEVGLEIGRDLSILSYDGSPMGAFATPPLTTFEVDSRRAGQRLAQLLIGRIRGGAAEDLRDVDRARLVPRASDGPPRLRSSELAAHMRARRSQ